MKRSYCYKTVNIYCKDYIVDIDSDVVFISKEDSENRIKKSKFSGILINCYWGNGNWEW
jgi:hypothetical protein